MELEMVRVTWHDAHSVGGGDWAWIEDDEDDGPMVVNHLGYLLPVDKGGKENHVTLCFGMTSEGALDSRIHIPAGMIVLIERLAENGERGLDRPTGISTESGPTRPVRRRKTGEPGRENTSSRS